MWKLTIEQTTKKKLTDGRQYDSTESVVYEAECIRDLLLVLPTLASTDTIGKTTYIVEKVVEE